MGSFLERQEEIHAGTEKERTERMITIIESVLEKITRLKLGLLSGQPSAELVKLAADSALAITIIEALITQ
jgi:hypothetical protein